MFEYYLRRGVRSLRRNPALTVLMVLILAVGVAASMSTLTIVHFMSANPLPHKSDRLFVPMIDNGPAEGYAPTDADRLHPQISYKDAMNFLRSGVGERRDVSYGILVPIEPARKDLPAMSSHGIAVTRDFFPMFDAPFLYGQAWGEAEDKAGADVVVLSQQMASLLFGDINPVGKRLRMLSVDFTVVGVLKPWLMVPKVYKVVGGAGAFGKADDYMIPFATAIRHEVTHAGGMSCMTRAGPGWQGRLDSECTWLQFFFETRTAAERRDVQDYLDNYAAEQRKLGRMKRNAPNRLFDAMEWLEFHRVVDNDSRLSAWLAFAFLALCLVNTIGLMLAKFSVRASEIGVRRALGASRRQIFQQFLTESAVVGLAGGILGLLLTIGALDLIAAETDVQQVTASMDWMMFALTFVMSLAAAILAGLLPAWRACQVTPAIQLKTQ